MYFLSLKWYTDLIISFFYSIDSAVYNAMIKLYDLLIAIARTSVFTQSDYNEFSNKVYMLLGIFMLFKVTFSLITYVVNPDDFADKSKGLGKIGQNAVISLALVVLVPYIFKYAYELQIIVLEDNTLATFILGDSEGEKSLYSGGNDMAYYTMRAFLSPNTVYYPECINYLTEKGKLTDDCYNSLITATSKGATFSKTDIENFKYGIESNSFGLFFRQNLVVAADSTASGANDNAFVYNYLISTAVGIIVCLLLITFCMDVGLRSIKLAFLQLIAPIPIISYIDPKSGKDGLFTKWYKMCFSTYISLFVRLLAMFFAIYIISKIGTINDIVTGATVTNFWIQVFIIIGALMFAKQLPKMLEGLGIKLDGDGKFTLNPFKKFEDQAFGGKQILGAGGAALAGGAAFGTNLIARKGNIFSAAAGALSATGRGLKSAAKGEGFGKSFSGGYKGAMQARLNRKERKDLGVSGVDYLTNKAQQALGIETRGQQLARVNQSYNDFASSTKAAKTEAESLVDKKSSELFDTYAGYTSPMSLEQAVAEAQVLENSGDSAGAARLRAAISSNKKNWTDLIQDRARTGSLSSAYSAGGSSYNATVFSSDDQVPIQVNLEAAEEVLATSPEARKLFKDVTGHDFVRGRESASDLGKVGKKASVEATRTSVEQKVQQKIDSQGAKKS